VILKSRTLSRTSDTTETRSKNPKLKSSLTFAYKWLFLSQELWVVLFVDVHVIVGEHCLTFQVFFSISIQKDANNQGTCKVRNEIKTKRNRTKRNRTERNEAKRNRVKCSIYFDQRQSSFTPKVRTIFTLKIIVSIFVKLFLILVLHLRQLNPLSLHTTFFFLWSKYIEHFTRFRFVSFRSVR
jgi:hypothetical protein